jgi:5-methylcytosine-specific restriction endonuclease McrA
MTYAEQLKSPKWQIKRLEILERDKFTCTSCGEKEKQLHVHHGYYGKNKKIWEYENETLVTLCFLCHNLEHELNLNEGVNRLLSIARFKGFDDSFIFNLLNKYIMGDISDEKLILAEKILGIY